MKRRYDFGRPPASVATVRLAAVLCVLVGVVGLAAPSHAQSPIRTDGPADTTRNEADSLRQDRRAATDSLPAGPFRRSSEQAAPVWTDDPLRGPIRQRGDETARARSRPIPPSQMPPKPEVEAPDLIQRYRTARNQMLSRQLLVEGRRGVPGLPVDRIATPSDTLRPVSPGPKPVARSEEDTTTFDVNDVHVLSRLERGWFEKKFADTGWSFLGSGRYFTLFDTTMTRELRARMQAHFGEPTQELADFDVHRRSNNPPDDYVQFEYWFVVNDSIPVKVMDAGGPHDRGLIVVADQSVREYLYALRQSLLRPLRRGTRAPYVDYWYEEETRRWYRTGFDGEAFFTERTYRSRMEPGRPEINSAPAD